MIKKVHHIAFIVRNLEKAKKLFEEAFGIPLYKDVFLENLGIDVRIYRVGDVLIEFIYPEKEQGKAYEYLKEHGEGFFHMALETDDIESDISQMVSKGLEIPDRVPKEGVEWKIVDIEPDSTLGIYLQLVSTA